MLITGLICLCFRSVPPVAGQNDTKPVTPIRFRDVAKEGGLKYVLENHPTPKKHMIETMAGGLAAFDYNGDGWTDIFFANGAVIPSLEKESPKYFNRLFRNEGGMKFSDVTEEAGVAGTGYSVGAATGDYDNDGDADLFVAGVNRHILYSNLGNGRFQDVTAEAGIRNQGWAVAAGWFDYDNDGWLDLFIVNYLDWSPEMDHYCGDRGRNIRAYCHPKFYAGLPNTLYRNRGDGTFEDVSKRSGLSQYIGKGMSIAFADYDIDGFMDVFVTNDKIPNSLFHNLGDGTFEEVALISGVALAEHGKPISSMGSDFRDYDNDGLPDICHTALAGETFPLYRNEGKGLFREVTYSSRLSLLSARWSGYGVGLFDFNNDGLKDLFTANAHVNDVIDHFESTQYKQSNTVFANIGGGQFRNVSEESGEGFKTPRAHRGAAFADFNNDGRIDVVVCALEGDAELWENISPGDNRWLILRLTGARSNRDGIGARIRIGNQFNHMTTAMSYGASSHFGVHFGVGRAEKIDEIEIRWPSRTMQVVRDVPTNQVLQVSEPPLDAGGHR